MKDTTHQTNATDFKKDPAQYREELLQLLEVLLGPISEAQVAKLDETLAQGPRAAKKLGDSVVDSLIRKALKEVDEVPDEEGERHRRNARRTAPRKHVSLSNDDAKIR